MGIRVRNAETLQKLPIGAAYKRFVLKYVASILGAAFGGGTGNVAAGAVRVGVWPYGDHRSIHDMQVGSAVVKASAIPR